MVEINNQRMFLDMLAVEGNWDNDVRKPEIMWAGRHCRRRAIYWLPGSPSQTCHAKPKTQINRRRTLFSVSSGQYQTAWPERLLSEKSGTLWHCSRLRSGALPMIDRGDIRQAIDCCSNIWASSSWALVMVSSSRRGWQPDCKIQRSGRNGQRDWCMSRVTAIISCSGYLHHRLPVMGR